MWQARKVKVGGWVQSQAMIIIVYKLHSTCMIHSGPTTEQQQGG